MVNAVKEISYPRKYGMIAGISLLLTQVSYGFVYSSLVVPGDATTTFNNIMSGSILFKAGIFGWLIIVIYNMWRHGGYMSTWDLFIKN